jgi:hypothetical protein
MPLKEVIPRPPKQPRKAFKPPEDHPWRTASPKFTQSMYDESDRQIIEALYSSRLAWR